MANKRKIKCDCGHFLKERSTKFDHFETEAMVCPNCGFTTLTREQAEKFAKIKQLHKSIDTERKIIRIGNSIGLTLPDSIKEFGAKVGKKVKIEALSSNSFKVQVIS